MRLKDLFPDTNHDAQITGIATDSRFVQPGFLFIPLTGKNFLGTEFILEATLKGASCIVLEFHYYQATIPVIVVENALEELYRILPIFYGKPDLSLKLIGVTGTDGKTTTSSMINHMLSSKYSTALMGTNGIYYQDIYINNLFTTPLLSETYRLLTEFKQLMISHVTMEVSSEGILSNRIKPFLFDYAIFTNITHEHLNTHHTMESYFQTKYQLFKQLKPHGLAIINQDDEHASRFNNIDNRLTYSINNPSDFQAINIKYNSNYLTFDLKTKDYIYKDLKLNRLELYNLSNALPSIIIALKEGVPISVIKKRLANIPIVPGRLERIATHNQAYIYIDFAHTPNAIANLLTEARKKTSGQLIIVCGATGNKDKSKRPLMGQIATNLADYVIFTSEDPYDENPLDIINQLTSNVTKHNYSKIVNRKSAISLGIALANPGDIVLVTGKGRETTITENGKTRPYSDIESIKEIVNQHK